MTLTFEAKISCDKWGCSKHKKVILTAIAYDKQGDLLTFNKPIDWLMNRDGDTYCPECKSKIG